MSVEKGETVGIVGRNGSGKSTLLQLIAGTLTPTTGDVTVGGRIAALLELGSGFSPEFTGRENVFLNASILGLTPEDIRDRFDAIAAFADIGEFMEQPLRTYSSGMIVRLAFAVASHVSPEILIVDEALAVGDERFQRKCYARLREFRDQGGTILFVSHAGSTVLELCDRAVLLERGKRLLTGAPNLVIKQYQRLLYAPPEEYDSLINTIIELDAENLAPSRSKSVPVGESAESEPKPASDSASALATHSASYDPDLKPVTTLTYAEAGARIEALAITDANGKPSNVFGLDQQFVVTYEAVVARELRGVQFGVHIRSVTGQELTGQVHPQAGEYVSMLRPGDLVRLKFRFDARLLPGVYFVGCGAWADFGAHCCHRVIDGLMFRVRGSSTNAFGVFDATQLMPECMIARTPFAAAPRK